MKGIKMPKAKLEIYDSSGSIIKTKKIPFWRIEEDEVAICINLNSPDENPTKKGYGKQIIISLDKLRKELDIK